MRGYKILLLVSSLGTLAALADAAYDEHVRADWRQVQRRVRAAAGSGFELKLRQIVVPELRTADRCVSCHVGMAPGETGVPGDPILGAHRDVAHDPAAFGCTVCHGGQGRATRTADAHGAVPHVPEPMLPRKYLWAGCGTCHTHLRVPNALVLERGQRFFEQRDCLACHRVDGRGGTARPGGAGGLEGPDLSRAGARGFRSDWYARHLAEKRTSKIPAWQTAFGEVPEEEREAIAVYLSARVGAPGLVEAKAAFHSLGCRGCHKVAGIGGDDGPDLTRAGQRDPGLTDFSHVAGPRTLESWWKEHFRAPATVVPGSPMPALGLSEAEIESLTFYLYSLRRSSFPESLWPKDRVLSERLGEREFASDGATLYGTFCAACHGPSGEGRRYPGMPAFPAIANPDFLRVASDDFLAATIRGGRPGRRMPAWGEGGGGLNSGDIEKLVAHLRKLGGGSAFVPDGKPRRWARGDVALGTSLFLANCAGCHGPDGAGNEGPALRNARLLEAASDSYLAETIRRGRHGTGMLGFAQSSSVQRALADGEIEALVSFIRTWEKKR